MPQRRGGLLQNVMRAIPLFRGHQGDNSPRIDSRFDGAIKTYKEKDDDARDELDRDLGHPKHRARNLAGEIGSGAGGRDLGGPDVSEDDASPVEMPDPVDKFMQRARQFDGQFSDLASDLIVKKPADCRQDQQDSDDRQDHGPADR
jgi:hypothetical protein